MIRRIARALGLLTDPHARWGVRYGGAKERSGFRTLREATTWAEETGRSFVVYEYRAIDLRAEEPNRSLLAQDRYIGGSN